MCDVVPLHIIVPVDVSTKRSKSVVTKKKKSSEKEPFVHVESMNITNKVDSDTTEKSLIMKPLLRNHMWNHMLNHMLNQILKHLL